ncbi:MAG: RNA polymerase sigma factor SigZ [Georgfuchsia sp.]
MKCIIDAWDAHQRELLLFVASRIPDVQEANDLVQEVFLRATRLDNGLCSIDNRRAWLFQVARNLLVDRYRLSREEVSLDEEMPGFAEAELPEPVDALSHCLPRVLSELSVEDREAITLCDVEGLSQRAFADHLGLTLPAAKSRVQRARKRLREQLVTACQVEFDEMGHVCCFVPRPPLAK